MSGYYPEGVTGNEYQIAGAQAEYSTERGETCYNEECSSFDVEDVEAEVEIELYNGTEYYSWTCPTCSTARDIERNVEEF